MADREEISRGLAESLEYKEIAVSLGRDPSIISREVARHGGLQRYRAVVAERVAVPAVADRFHLWKDLGEAVEATVVTHRACLPEPKPELPEVETTAQVSDTPLPVPDGVLDACGRERRLVVRTRERFTAAQQLRAEGLSLGAISRQLGLDHGTVRRFARASNVDELLVKATHRTSTLDRFKPYVNQRWNEGCHDAVQLHTELQARGWTGSVQTLRRYVRAFRATAVKAPTTPAPPKLSFPR